MASECYITFEGDYVQILSDGDKDFEFASRLWAEAVSVCEQHDCFHILGIANTTRPLKTMEAFRQAELFRELGITRQYRIAWVEQNPRGYETAYFVESVLSNSGFRVRLFPNVQNARKWLLSENDP